MALSHRHVPPLRPVTSRWSLELPDSPSSLEEELHKQESLLTQLHQELLGVKDSEKEDKLWEVQRVVTQLKRKVRVSEWGHLPRSPAWSSAGLVVSPPAPVSTCHAVIFVLSLLSGIRLSLVSVIVSSSFLFTHYVLYHQSPTPSIFCCCSISSSHSFQIPINPVLPSHSRSSLPPFSLHFLSI